MSHREADLATDKAVNCEQLHEGAWETRAQRGSCDPFGPGSVGLAYFNVLDGQTPGLPHECSPVLRDLCCLPSLTAG